MKLPRSPPLVHLATLVTVWVALRIFAVALFPSSAPPLGNARPGVDRQPPFIAGPAFSPAAGKAGQGPVPSLPKGPLMHLTVRAAWHLPQIREEHPAMRLQASREDLTVAVGASAATEMPHPLIGDSVAQPGTNESPAAALRHWSLSGYALVRPGSGNAGIAPNGQLGGSQAGLRVQRTLAGSSRFSLSGNGRVSASLGQRVGKEAGLGLALRRSGRVPVELLIERRVALDRGGRDAFAALAAGGFDDARLPGRVLLSGYVQAGVVGLKRRDGFVDGALRAEHDLLTVGKTGIRIGALMAGARQPSVSRLDAGPEIAARFRLAGTSVRLGAEWRERIGGNAAPGSGPAITFGLDY